MLRCPCCEDNEKPEFKKSFFFARARAKQCVRVCLLCLGAVQRIACDELVRSEECTCCPRICATAVTHMDPALLHRMNDLIQGRRITPQLLTSCLTFNVNYQDYQELNDLRQLTKAMNASTLSRVVMNKSVIIKVLISIAQQQEIEIRNLRLEIRGLELRNDELERYQFYDPEDDVAEIR